LCTPGRAPFLPIESHHVDISAFNWYESRAMGGMHNSKSSWFFNHSSASSVQEHSLSVIELSRPLVEAIQRKDRDLASQLRRTLSSVSLNLAEGFGCAGGNARLRFETAIGSLKEAQAGFRVAVAWGYISPSTAAGALASLHSLGGRVYGLVRRQPACSYNNRRPLA
jgi:four helix bundle protein